MGLFSKGVQVYFYSAVKGCKVEFCTPGYSIKRESFRSWSSDHLEVESDKCEGWFNNTGRFSFRVVDGDGNELAYQWVDVNSATGNLGDGTMNKIEQMRTITCRGVLISYGLYDAGSGVYGLPDRHQCHVTASCGRSNWMGEVAPVGSPAENMSLSRFALPCPHDCGMNSMQSTDMILNSPAVSIFTQLLSQIPGVPQVLSNLIEMGYVRKVVYALAVTQKDSIMDMLRLGCRYFEFRPAKMPQQIVDYCNLENKYYFVHSVIPGIAYDEFLDNVLEFLGSNPSEIVVVHLRTNGIEIPCIPFNNEDADAAAKAAIERKGNGVQFGNEHDMQQRTISQLRQSNQRLIIVKETSQYNTWNEPAYATLNAGSIIEEFKKVNKSGQSDDTFTLLQCQATATSIPDIIKYSVLASNASTSCLMATKAMCDTQTHPWLQHEVLNRLDANHSLVIMDDWIEGATCDVAIELSKQRFQISG